MNKNLSELIMISRTVGKDSAIVQGSSGNTSVKTADSKYMYIKATGTALKDLSAKRGWRKLRIDTVTEILYGTGLSDMDSDQRQGCVLDSLTRACCDSFPAAPAPSIEAHLHALLGPYVIHVHPDTVAVYVSASQGRLKIVKLFSDLKLPPLWIGYGNPGYDIAKKTARLIARYRKLYGCVPAVMFLAKHGLFVTADTPEAALKLVKTIVKRCAKGLLTLKTAKVPALSGPRITIVAETIRSAFKDATGKDVEVTHHPDARIIAFARQKDARRILVPGALSPNEMAYTHGPPMLVALDRNRIAGRLTTQTKASRLPSRAFIVKDVGLFLAGVPNEKQTMFDTVISSLFIRSNAIRLGGIVALTKAQQDFVCKFESA